MQAVKWTYYGDDSTYTNALQTYGTKFAADNWMHKSMGIQLGLTNHCAASFRKERRNRILDNYNYSSGYEDLTVQFQATDANIVKPAKEKDTH